MKKIARRIGRVGFKLTRKIYKALDIDGMRWHNTYLQYFPDRYSTKFDEYKKTTNFLSYSDLKVWNKGNYINNVCDVSRFIFLNLCIDTLLEENIKGNVAELGVYKGNSAFLLSRFAKRMKTKCYLFDTFTGFDANDIVGLDKNTEKTRFSDTSLEAVQSLMGDNTNNVFVKGYFPESLEQVGEIDAFNFVHIDCDLEKPFLAALEYFYPRLVKGGFLIMHDYSSLEWKGAKNAIDSFFKDKNEFVIPVADKSGTCVIRKM